MQENVLIVEDEAILREVLYDYFNHEGYQSYEAADGHEALALFQSEAIHLVILDIMLPDVDGWSVCRRIRKTSNVPIIMLTARSDEDDTLLGFELGADDYVTKPYSPAILLARAKRLIHNMYYRDQTHRDVLRLNGVTVDSSSHTVKVNESSVHLTHTEFEVLLHLMRHEGIVITREQLIIKIWGYEYLGDDRTINTHIRNLRHKLGEKSSLIQTIIGSGYKFEGRI